MIIHGLFSPNKPNIEQLTGLANPRISFDAVISEIAGRVSDIAAHRAMGFEEMSVFGTQHAVTNTAMTTATSADNEVQFPSLEPDVTDDSLVPASLEAASSSILDGIQAHSSVELAIGTSFSKSPIAAQASATGPTFSVFSEFITDNVDSQVEAGLPATSKYVESKRDLSATGGSMRVAVTNADGGLSVAVVAPFISSEQAALDLRRRVLDLLVAQNLNLAGLTLNGSEIPVQSTFNQGGHDGR